jgi:hypothetical protein
VHLYFKALFTPTVNPLSAAHLLLRHIFTLTSNPT